MPHDPDLIRLCHMWEAAREAIGYAAGRSRQDLASDRPLQHSLVRLLEIIGEAAGTISEHFRAEHPEIPWRAMVGMRNRLVHAYFDVNLDVVWRTVTEELPRLIAQIEPILKTAGLL